MMSAQVIDGRACAGSLMENLAADLTRLREDGLGAGLATVTVGEEYSSGSYDRRLRRLAEDLGVAYVPRRLAQTATEAEVISVITRLNDDSTVSGILVLRPLPAHVNEAAVFGTIDPRKDVEAVHPENAGLLTLGVPRFVPPTAAAVFHLLDTWLDSAGQHRGDFYHRSLIVVVGRSNTVGKPAISLGYQRQATVESVDEWANKTTGIGRRTRWADVLIVAVGKAGLIKAEHVNEHAVVIDVGINPVKDEGGRMHLVGDVDYASVAPRVRAITPVPGGVGPVTDVWLLRNTVTAARLLAGRPVADSPGFRPDSPNRSWRRHEPAHRRPARRAAPVLLRRSGHRARGRLANGPTAVHHRAEPAVRQRDHWHVLHAGRVCPYRWCSAGPRHAAPGNARCRRPVRDDLAARRPRPAAARHHHGQQVCALPQRPAVP
jgi:methylenetetrahydrofolate dehydrogenase (NADP+)/methenyltetrahydrofolate cyclohydrolase